MCHFTPFFTVEDTVTAQITLKRVDTFVRPTFTMRGR